MVEKKKKKQAKTAHKKKIEHEFSVSKLVMITGEGHRVSTTTQLFSDCGVRRMGWRFGEAEDVTCKFCLEG